MDARIVPGGSEEHTGQIAGQPAQATTLPGAAEMSEKTDQGEQHQRGFVGRLVFLGGALGLFILSAWYHFLIYAPQPNHSHRFTILDDFFALGLMGIVALAGLAMGRRVMRLFPPAGFSRLEWNTLALGLGWGIGSLSILAIGLAHLLYPWALALLVGLALALCWRETWHILTFLTWQRLIAAVRRCIPRGRLEVALAVLLAPELFLLGLQSLALPYVPYGSDAYLYHWVVPQLYLLHHAIIIWPGWAAADVPLNSEMFSTLALAFRSEVAAIWLQAVFGIAIILLLAGYLHRMFGRKAVWLGVTLCCANPLFASLLFSSQPELAASYYGIASLLVALAWLKQTQSPETRGRLRLLALAGLFAGFGLGVKYTEGQILIGILLLLFSAALARLLANRKYVPTRWQDARRACTGILLYGAACLFALSPWLLRDWALLGNPIYPFLWGGPGWNAARLTSWRLSTAHIGIQGTVWRQMALGLFDLFLNTQRNGDQFYAPPNYVLLLALLAPIVLLIGWRFSRSGRQSQRALALQHAMPWLVVAGSAYIAWILSQAKVTYYAFLWLLLLTPPAVLVLEHIWQSAGRWLSGRLITRVMQFSLPALFALVVLVQGPLYSVSLFVQRSPLPLLAGQQSLHEWETTHLMDADYWTMVDYINVQVPPSAKILVIGHGYFLDGYDYVDDAFLDWVPYLETQGKTPEGMLRLLRQQGFAYLIYDGGLLQSIVKNLHNAYLGSFLPAFQQFMARWLHRLGAFGAYQVYQIPGAA